jgi:tetratricopeptide (TPR) repeat protein
VDYVKIFEIETSTGDKNLNCKKKQKAESNIKMSKKKNSGKKSKIQSKKTNIVSKREHKTQPFNLSLRRLSLVVGLFAVLLYANTLNHRFVLDDDLVCSKNRFVQEGFTGLADIFSSSWYEGFHGEKDSYYRPMMLAGFAIEKSLFGHSPKVYHAMNIFWYGISMIILVLLFRKMFTASKPWLVLAIALLYAAHPIHVEVVANIKSRDEIFSLLGLLGTLYGLVCYEEKGKKKWLVMSLGAFFFALLSKESSLAFFALVPLTLHFFSINSLKNIVIKSLPYAVMVGIYLLIRSTIISSEELNFGTLDNALFAAEGLGEQTATAVAMVGKYIQLLFFPHPLMYDYSFNQIPLVDWSSWQTILSLVIIMVALIYSMYGWRKKDKIAYAIWFFAITSVITNNIFFLIGTTFAERLMFIPSLGFCMLIVLILSRLLKKPSQEKIMFGIFGTILIFYIGKTFMQNSVWVSNETLFSHGIQVSTNSTRINAHYAKSIFDSALKTTDPRIRNTRLKESISYFEKSIEILPSHTQAYQNMGLALEELEQLDRALVIYQKGISTGPSYSPIIYNTGTLLFNMGKYEEALSYLQKAIEIEPNNDVFHNTLGLNQHRLQNYEAAIASYKIAHELQPDKILYISKLVAIHRELNQIETAIFYDKKITALK